MIKVGKRYWWYMNNYENKVKSGLYTGKKSKNNNNVILLTKKGEIWSVPEKDLMERNPLI